jgi:hypothetical protein
MKVQILSAVKPVVLFVMFSLQALPGLAQPIELEVPLDSSDQWRREGQLVTIQISRGSPIRIFVVGKEEAKLDLTTLSLTVRRIKPYPAKVLSVSQFSNYFVVSDPQEFHKSKEIEIVTKVKGTNETFHFNLKQKLP